MKKSTAQWAHRSFRWEKDLDQWILKRAQINLRSLNSEVVYILRKERDAENAPRI